MDFFLQLLFNGLAIGAIYALIAVGYSLVYGVLQFVNFAHGDLCITAPYFLLLLWKHAKWPFGLSAMCAVGVTILIGCLTERIAYRPLKNAPRLMPLLSALGVSIVLQNAMLLGFGGQAQSFNIPYLSLPALKLGGAIMSGIGGAVLVISLLVGLTLILLLRHTRIGLMIRMVASDREAAETLGVNSGLIFTLVFAAASFIGGIGGILVSSIYDLTPTMGIMLGFKAFTACVVGGIKSLQGCMLAGIGLGIVENLAAGYLSSEFKDAYAFIVLILVLLLRPQGLFTVAKRRVA